MRRRPEVSHALQLVAVSFEPCEVVARFRDVLRGDLFRLCCDPQRLAYRAFGLPRVSTRRLLGRRTALVYARATLRGRWPFGARGDVHQIGGDFVLDARGIVRFAYVSREPGDRPAAEALVAAMSSDPQDVPPQRER
jgi:AhpC/TSA antioxidant enzyme